MPAVYKIMPIVYKWIIRPFIGCMNFGTFGSSVKDDVECSEIVHALDEEHLYISVFLWLIN